MITLAALAASVATLPDAAQCQAAVLDPEAALAQSTGLQAFIYGYPMVDLLKQQFNETHGVDPGQPVAAPVKIGSVLTFAHAGRVRVLRVEVFAHRVLELCAERQVHEERADGRARRQPCPAA